MKLEEKLRWLDGRRVAWLDQLQALPPDLLAVRPRPDKWSILEIVEHLIVSERVVFHGLLDFSLLVDRPRRLEHRFRYLLVWALLHSALPIRMPSPALAPSGNRDLGELRRLWDENLEWLFAYVGGLDARGLRKAVFEHPAAGPLTVAQAVRLNQIHVERHLGQVEAILRGLAPGTSSS